MKNFITLSIIPLTESSFAPFGQVVMGSAGAPNYSGEGWKSLFPAAKAHIPNGEIGWVITKPKEEYIVYGMEREPEVEIIWPVTGPIIHVVAPPGDLKNHTEQPNAQKTKAFIVQPGQIIIMHPGTWHYASFPAGNEGVFYYFITKDHPREPGWEDVPWVPFYDNKKIALAHSL
jgi:ureidoglycolate lyase